MTEQISIRDWERLSAYLDNDLEAGRRAKLEQRLRAEPVLQRGLQRLQRTRELLRRAPQARVPRAFTLTRAQAGQGGGWLARLNLNLSTVSAFASLMLVVVLLGDLFTFGGTVDFHALAGPSAAEMADDDLMALSAPVEEESADQDMAGDENAEADALPATTPLAEEDAGGESFEEERSLAAAEEPSAARDPWLLAELALAFTALLTGLGARRARQRRQAAS